MNAPKPRQNVMKKPLFIYYAILNYTQENRELLARNFEVVELADPREDTPELLARAEAILAPLGHRCGRDKIDAAPGLKVIGSNTTGHPHIDVEYARSRGIAVVTLKDHQDFLDTITPTSELTFGLIIALTRKMLPAAQSVLAGRWERWPFGGEAMLSRMRLGVIGLGRLGRKVAHYGKAFGMTVRYNDPFVENDDYERVESLVDLAAVSDILTLHVPHEPETERMIGQDVFAALPRGSWFVNTARGELVDEAALLAALESGHLGGAATDVLDGEFVPDFSTRAGEHPLVRYARSHDNLIITPHIGGSTRDAWHLTQEYTVLKMIEALGLPVR